MTLNPNAPFRLSPRSPASPRSRGSHPCNVLTLGLLLGWFALSLSPLPAQTQPRCPRQNSATAFIYRERDARCEGITSRPVSSADVRLVSFTTGTLPNSPSLQIEIPTTQTPNVEVLSRQDFYQMIPLSFRPGNNRQRFQWSNDILRRKGIPVKNLRANAFVRNGSQQIYLPVLLPQGKGVYSFVLDMPNHRSRVRRFQITGNGRTVFNPPAQTRFQREGEIAYTWDARNIPAGNYRLSVQVELEQRNAPPKSDGFEVTIQHNPQWLR